MKIKLYILSVLLGLAQYIYAQAPTNGLIAHYTFSGNTNNVAGTNYNGTATATLTTDRYGTTNNAYSFNGSQNIDLGNVTELITNSPFSITFWIKAPSSTTLSRAIISNLNSNKNFYVSLLNTGKIYFGFGNGSSMAGFASNLNIADDTWHHVAITYDNTAATAKIYIDGALDNTRTSTTITKQYGKTMIGDHPSSVIGLSKMTGNLDEFRMYNRLISATEVESIFNMEKLPAAQTAPNIIWDKTIGGSGSETNPFVIATPDGGFVIAGSSAAGSGISGDKTEASKGGLDYWIVKLNAQGQKIWDKTIGGSGYEEATDIIQTADGGFVVAGMSNSYISGDKSEDSRGSSENSTGVYDYWIVKLNAQGQKVWDKTLGGSGYDRANSIIETSDGSLLIAGRSNSGISGDKTEASKGGNDYWIVKLNAQGQKIWDKTIGGSSGDGASSIIQTSDGGFVVVGWSSSDISGDKSENSRFLSDIDYWIVKLNAQGQKVWDKTLGGTSDESASSIIQTADGGFVVAGTSNSYISGDKTEASKGGNDYWIVKLNAQGQKIWDKTIGGSSGDGVSSIIQTSDGDFVVVGGSSSDISGDKSEGLRGYRDYWIIKLNTQGQKVWDKTIGGSNDDNAKSILQTTDGGFVVVGDSYSGISGDKTGASKGEYDYWIVKLAGTTTPSTTLSLSSTLKFAGGLTTLEQNKAYSYNFEVKNTGTATLTGEVYMRVGTAGSYTLIIPNNTYTAGATTGLSGMFTPTAGQIGSKVAIELFFKKSDSSTYESLGVINGAKNPVLIDIIAQLQEPVVREPFISLSKQEIEPGQSVVLSGGNFTPSQALNIEVFPTISGFSYTGFTVAADGSFRTTLSFPASTKEDNVTINVSNGQGKGAGKTLLIAQPEDVAELKITKPSVAGQQILIQPQGYVVVELSDKLIPKSNYPLVGSSRSYRYEIGFRYGGGTVDFPLLTTEVEKGFVNNNIQKSYLVKMDAFSTISSPEGWPIQYYVKDLYDNSRKVYSPTINLVIVNQLSKVDLKWDASLPFEPVSAPKGIAADGTSRMYLLAEKVSAGGSPIANLAVQLTSYESNQDNTLNNTSWLGKVMYATNQSTVNYTEEANAANSTVAVKLSPNANGKYYFWYVAPEDFTVPNLPSHYSLNDKNERTVFAKFTITYADNTTEILTKEITVIRPPLMLVHGLSGDEHSWDKFKLKDEALWKIAPKAVRMLPDAMFSANGLGLVNQLMGISYESSFQSILTTYRSEGWVANRVDYVCHSMGGLMLRALVENFPNLYYVGTQSNEKTKNYGKGYVNKFITINTPHNGSPVADLLTFTAPKMPIWLKTVLTANYIGTNFDTGIKQLNSFVTPTNKIIQANGSYIYNFKTTDAVRNLMTNKFGIVPDGYRFNETNLKSHLIASDVFAGDLLPSDQFMQQLLIIEACRLTFEFGKAFLSAKEYYKHARKIGLAKDFNIADYQALFKQLGNDLRSEILEPAVVNNLWISFESQYCSDLATDDSDYLRAMNQYFDVYGNWNKKYSDFLYNGDWIVPLLSQTANKFDSPNDNVTVLHPDPLVDDDLVKLWNNAKFSHVTITDIDETRVAVKSLLNSSINSSLFNKIPANNNPVPQVYVPSSDGSWKAENNISKNSVLNNTPEKPLIERFNRNKVAITSPTANSTFENSDNITVKVNVSDTVKLVSCKVVVGNDLKDLEQRSYNYSFIMKPNLIPNIKNFVLAAATYSYSDSVVIIYDSLSVNATTSEQPIKLIAKPKNYEIGVGQKFTPSLVLVYPSFTRSPISDNGLSVVVENSNSLEWNGDLKVFIGKKQGESKVVFSYQGLKDSVFVVIDKGGISPSNTLTTSAISTQSVCQGGVISVPYAYNGTFENDNSFLIQLAPDKSLDFETLNKIGNGNPQLVRIPNNTPAGSGYQIRTVSTKVPIIGSKSSSSLTVTAFGTPPVVSTNKNEFKLGETVTLSATGCSSTIKWSNGQTGNSITISPTESGIYKAVCTNTACSSADSEPIIINKYLCVPSIIKTGETTAGVNLELAGVSINSTEKIKGNGTKMTYEAPSITLNPGFSTETGVIFKVQIGGCN